MNHTKYRQRATIAVMAGIVSDKICLKYSFSELAERAHNIAEALLAEEIKRHGEEGCEHEWVDARNEVIKSGEICLKCGELRAGNNDWIQWNGGECPVSPDTVVEVELREGLKFDSRTANYWYWYHSKYEPNGDIIRYRVVEG